MTRSRPQATFLERHRTEGRVTYGCPLGVEVVAGVGCGLLGVALWGISFKTLQEARGLWVAGGLFLGLLAAGWAATFLFHSVLTLDFTRGEVIRGRRSGSRLWVLAKAEVSYVAVWVDHQGIAYAQVTRSRGGTFIVDKGIDEGNIRALASDLAKCWDAPLRSTSETAP
ncbi:MAG TPA: hypothetical protein VEN81_15220 [Planctomycetota bacterium]|nr:hypothetical protein [Planctomycetota bacterium]